MSADLSITQHNIESPDNVVDMEASGNHFQRPRSLTKLRKHKNDDKMELASTIS